MHKLSTSCSYMLFAICVCEYSQSENEKSCSNLHFKQQIASFETLCLDKVYTHKSAAVGLLQDTDLAPVTLHAPQRASTVKKFPELLTNHPHKTDA